LNLFIDKKGTVKNSTVTAKKTKLAAFKLKRNFRRCFSNRQTACSPTWQTTTELDDILIVEQDCSSEMLEVKKAIVETTLTFRIFLLCLKAFKHSLKFTGQTKLF
jgi:hypothetical protein